jgi:asparagine synthase (glutamine-hydrolysing)
MCGINGIAFSSRSGALVDPDVLVRMRDVMTHRGPDEAGLFARGPVGLGHRRLSIVDLKTGQQPMTNEDGSLHIVFNGEIYNHADYRPELEARGHRYSTRSDTETILHLYEEHGPAVVDFLRGMFAMAIWDATEKRLFLARDRLGIKPLYYVHTADGSLFFASEIKALLAGGAVRPELNHAALPDYLANHATSDDQTLFAGVKRLLPGHTLLWRDGALTVRQYWDVPLRGAADAERPDSAWIDEWRELFRTSVKLRLMSDVPLGMFLSGGIDSSAIAGMMSRMVTEPIKTFSVAFDEREANELEYARSAARAFGTDHHEVVVSAAEFFAELPRLVWHEDEPIGHPASVPLYFVSRLAKDHVTVVLTGEGADELLGGYARYRKTLINLRLASLYGHVSSAGLRRLVRGAGERVVPPRWLQKLRRTFLWRPADVEDLYFDNFAVFPRASQQALLVDAEKERAGAFDPYAGLRSCFERRDGEGLLNRLLYTDIKTYLHELLMKQDQMSMAASIESRVPFLDHKLVEFTAALPERLKLRGGITKFVLRTSMKGAVPDEILRRPKMGFPVPIGTWFRGKHRRFVEEHLLGERAARRGLFSRSFVKTLVEEHGSGRADHSERLWSLVNLEIWQRVYLDGDTPAVRSA